MIATQWLTDRFESWVFRSAREWCFNGLCGDHRGTNKSEVGQQCSLLPLKRLTRLSLEIFADVDKMFVK